MPQPWKCSGQCGLVFDQPGQVGAVPAHVRGLEVDDLSDSFQPKTFHDPIKHKLLLRLCPIYKLW